jgi:anti-sigma-K factor RskA
LEVEKFNKQATLVQCRCRETLRSVETVIQSKDEFESTISEEESQLSAQMDELKEAEKKYTVDVTRIEKATADANSATYALLSVWLSLVHSVCVCVCVCVCGL